jgi:hypothetical protein
MSRILLSSSLAFFLGFVGNAAAQPPTKEVVIYNNSTSHTIFPVFSVPIYSGANVADLWMQAQFNVKTTDTYTQLFQTTKVYRAYVNLSNGGIPPGHSATISVPFYTQLLAYTASNLGTVPDQFIDWWNAERLYLFADSAAVSAASITDGTAGFPQPVAPYPGAAAPTCTNSDGSPCVVSLFANTIEPPANIPFQLLEYTFASAEGPPPGGSLPPGSRLTIDVTKVNYDVSALDSVYLPIALGPLHKQQPLLDPTLSNYLGTGSTVEAFNSSVAAFAAGGAGWPFFVPAYFVPGTMNPLFGATCSLAPLAGQSAYLFPKTPGTYNLLVDSYDGYPSSSTTGTNPPIPPILSSQPANYATFPGYAANMCVSMGIDPYATPNLGTNGQEIVNLWGKCTASSSDVTQTCKDIRTVSAFFISNYTASCTGVPDVVSTLVAVYGWVPIRFPQYSAPFCQGRALATTPRYTEAIKAYCRLQYNYLNPDTGVGYIFNPYTQLIHQTLKSSAYAFSIDDQLAFRHLTDTGIIIAIGGTHGLIDTTPTALPTARTYSEFCRQ